MLTVKCFTVGLFQTNMYVVSDEQGNALLVDPACGSAYEQQTLLQYIQSLPVGGSFYILATHGHLDHLWGAPWACSYFGQTVYMHPADIPMAQAMQQQYDLFGVRMTAQSFPLTPFPVVNDGPSFSFPGMEGTELGSFSLIHTPGHTPGSVCFYWEKEHILLSGDTLFCCGYGRTDLPGGNTGQLICSLQNLMALPPETRVYSGHGESTTIAAERR